MVLGRFDGKLEPLHCQRILGPYIDVPVMGVDRLGGNDHAFEHGVGVRLHDAPVHERARVTLVPVAQNVLDITGNTGAEFPFETCQKACAAPAAQTGFLHFDDDLLGCHLGERLGRSHVAVAGDVFLDLLGIDEAPVPERPEHLVLEERDVVHHRDRVLVRRRRIEELLDRPALDEMLLNEMRHIFGLHQLIEDVLGVDHHDRALGAEPVAAGQHDLDLLLEVPLDELSLERVLDLERSVGNAAGACANHYVRTVCRRFHDITPHMNCNLELVLLLVPCPLLAAERFLTR